MAASRSPNIRSQIAFTWLMLNIGRSLTVLLLLDVDISVFLEVSRDADVARRDGVRIVSSVKVKDGSESMVLVVKVELRVICFRLIIRLASCRIRSRRSVLNWPSSGVEEVLALSVSKFEELSNSEPSGEYWLFI